MKSVAPHGTTSHVSDTQKSVPPAHVSQKDADVSEFQQEDREVAAFLRSGIEHVDAALVLAPLVENGERVAAKLAEARELAVTAPAKRQRYAAGAGGRGEAVAS